ncbi:hypothetical protein C1637_08720 [Chryseobacterium lactis]|uniref:Uncharacterized protein n=1 Tax=Chryseobacterium lactis TaxID=1241981 RepID=A0A3G6RL35_CHRLC|nr:hypothetical protein EG342_10975 [Chryseobacterium lactis]AZB02764.1 hypothetical protein EG341_01835 [Chryseobacterium lactis]PNW13942.1 hypothetical protein C1637_08720 [Chryseobacterium lactis]
MAKLPSITQSPYFFIIVGYSIKVKPFSWSSLLLFEILAEELSRFKMRRPSDFEQFPTNTGHVTAFINLLQN